MKRNKTFKKLMYGFVSGKSVKKLYMRYGLRATKVANKKFCELTERLGYKEAKEAVNKYLREI